MEIAFLRRIEEVMEQVQTLFRIQLIAVGTDLIKLREQRCEHAGKIGAGFFDTALADRHGDVLFLHDGIGAFRLVQQHTVVLAAVGIESVICVPHENISFEAVHIHAAVVDGDFGRCAHIKRIENVAVLLGHFHLFRIAGGRVIHVLKAEHFAVLVLAHKENAVVPDTSDGNGYA